MGLRFETERLRVRDLEPNDLAWLQRLHADPEVMRFIRPPDTAEQTARRLPVLLALAEAHPGLGVMPAELDGAPVGWLVLNPLEGGAVELGYRLFRERWGRGLATEGACGLVTYAREALGLRALEAFAHPDNAASHRVLEKVGFTKEGLQSVQGLEQLAFSWSAPVTQG